MTKINSDLSSLSRPLSFFKADPKNARKHAKRDLKTIADSLTTHGQQKPIVAMRDGTVIAGNGTLAAAASLGWDSLAAVVYDDEDEAKARAFAIVDNRSAELSEWDFEALAAELRTLPEDLLATVGFVDYELEPLLRANWAPPDVDASYEQPEPKDLGSRANTIFLNFGDASRHRFVTEAIEQARKLRNAPDLSDADAVFLLAGGRL